MPTNLNDIQESSWISSFLFEAVKWLNPIVYVVGLGIAVWAFSRCRKCGYLVIAFYFAFCLFYLLAMPSINRAIQAHRTPSVSAETEKKIDEAVRQATDQVLKKEGYPLVLASKTVKFPFGPIILVVGLWLIARREPPVNTSPDSK
jgi:hypothetical protein